jgi:hypothetical protein
VEIRASARARNNSRQRGKKSERVAVPDLITKRIAKEGVGSPLGEIGRLQPYEEANSYLQTDPCSLHSGNAADLNAEYTSFQLA